MSGAHQLSDPMSADYNPNFVIFTNGADIAYAFGSMLGFAMPTARCVSAGAQAIETTQKLVIQFGGNADQVAHAFRHVERLGLNKNEVMSAIKNHLPTTISKIQEGKPLNEVITVAGKEIQYTAFKLSDGTINVGRIHGTAKP